MHFRHPTDEQFGHVDIFFYQLLLIICSLSNLNVNLNTYLNEDWTVVIDILQGNSYCFLT